MQGKESTMTDLANPLSNVRVLQCPGCESWQLDYSTEVMAQWAAVTMPSGKHPLDKLLGMPTVSLKAFDEVIEAILREHVGHECPHPRLILELLKGGGELTL